MSVRTGLDRLADEPAVARLVRGRRVGLLVHAASVDRRLRHAVDVLVAAGADLRVLFGPEHGLFGHAQDMVPVASGGGALTVHSLYGPSEKDLSPRSEWLDGLDVVVIDLQDVGSRYYTYVWTAALMMCAASRKGIETIALDRPNPIGGEVVEGAPQRSGYRSFVGLYDVAVRHGLTLGEILRMVADIERVEVTALNVVQMTGWRRSMMFADTELPWVLPSPNMPTFDTALVYPGGCLLEATNLSEGRGTTRPFEIWGAPFVDGDALARAVTLEGATLRPLKFSPTHNKHKGELCGGVQVHVTEPSTFRAYESYLRLVAAARAMFPSFAWRNDPYEFVADRPAIDLLTGGPEFRQAVESAADLRDVLENERRGAARFAQERRAWLLYP